ncbi:MAG: tetratricopeptide repeat protein [Opitutales bacterium]|nr:tetratricopeptide repeat protein [Opitutales bacterium]
MIDVGDSLLAYDVAKVGLKRFPEDRTLSQKAASALINAGSPLKATHILEELLAVGDRDVEAHSLLASAYKDLWQYASDPESKQRYAALAIARYKEGFSTTSFDAFKQSRVKDVGTEYYPCINVAFMYLLSGDAEEARSYSTRALEICRNLKLNSLGDYWSQATTGEAYLIEGELDASLEAYAEAVAMPDAEPAKIATTRTQAIQIASAYEDPMVLEKISGVFPQTGILACSGHVIDNTGGSVRFPPEAEALAKAEIEAALDKLDCSYGFSSAACGTDILFIEAMLARGSEVHVFLPFNKKDFIETSVRRGGGGLGATF